MQSDIPEKQAFLFRQIIEGGYSPEEFQAFLQKKNPQNGIDLSCWPMNSLIEATNQFKAQLGTNQSPQSKDQTEQIQENDNEEEPSQTSSPLKQGSSALAYNEKHQTFQKTITCLKSPLTYFFGSKSKITIEKYEKREGGVFEKSFFVYHIRINPLGQSSVRRYSDFEWMRDTLVLLHPGYPIPPISKKGKTDDKHLTKRMYLLEKFLNKMFSIPQIRADQVFQKFLTIEGQKQFEKYKTKFKKLKTVPMEKMQTISGTVNLALNEQMNTFVSRTQKYFSVTQPQLKKVYKGFKGAATMLQNCSVFLKGIGQNCHKLGVNYRQFRKQCALPQTEQNLFSLLDEMTSRYSQLLNEQAKTFRKQIYSLVKFESFYRLNMIQSLNKIAQLQQAFIEEKLSLTKKKEKLYDEGNMTKWGLVDKKLAVKPIKEQAFQIILPKQTKETVNHRNKYALYNSQIYMEAKRHFTQNANFEYQYLEQIVKMQTDISSRSIMVWADVLTKTKGLTVTVQ